MRGLRRRWLLRIACHILSQTPYNRNLNEWRLRREAHLLVRSQGYVFALAASQPARVSGFGVQNFVSLLSASNPSPSIPVAPARISPMLMFPVPGGTSYTSGFVVACYPSPDHC